MSKLLMSPLVQVENNQLVTTSLKLAEVFSKEHSHILRDIREKILPFVDKNFRLSNFGLSSYSNDQNKQQPMYFLTRDRFTLLAMSFTGKKAMQFKIAYINAFNQMEQYIKEQSNALAPVENIKEYKALLDYKHSKIQALEAENRILSQRLVLYDFKITLKKLLYSYASECCGGIVGKAYNALYEQLYTTYGISLKDRRAISPYKQLSLLDFIKPYEETQVLQIAVAMCKAKNVFIDDTLHSLPQLPISEQ